MPARVLLLAGCSLFLSAAACKARRVANCGRRVRTRSNEDAVNATWRARDQSGPLTVPATVPVDGDALGNWSFFVFPHVGSSLCTLLRQPTRLHV